MSCKSPQPFSPSILPSSTESAPFPFTPLIQKVSLIESDFARISLSPSLLLSLPLFTIMATSIYPSTLLSLLFWMQALSLSLSLSLPAMPVWVQPGAISFSRLEIQINFCFFTGASNFLSYLYLKHSKPLSYKCACATQIRMITVIVYCVYMKDGAPIPTLGRSVCLSAWLEMHMRQMKLGRPVLSHGQRGWWGAIAVQWGREKEGRERGG